MITMGFFKKAKKDEQGEAAQGSFTLEGKKYNVTKPAIVQLANGLNKLTIADICASPEAQGELVRVGASCIEEATD